MAGVPNRRCVFCSGTSGHFKCFSEQSLNKCSEILIIRKTNKLSYNLVTLPTKPDDEENVYHCECYKKFTALPPKHRPKKTSVIEVASVTLQINNNVSTLETIQEAEEPSSSIIRAASTSQTSSKDDSCSASKTSRDNTSADLNDDLQTSGLDADITDDNNKLASLDIFDDEHDDKDDDGEEDTANHMEECTDITCVFCKKKQKKNRGRHEKLLIGFKNATLDDLESIVLGNEEFDFLDEIQRLRKKEKLAYHQVCKTNYQYNLVRNSRVAVNDEWHETRNKHKSAFQEVCRFVSENIIRNQESYYLDFLHNLYMDVFSGNSLNTSSYFLPCHLALKLMKTFKNKIDIKIINGKKVVIEINSSVARNDLMKLDERDILNRASLIMRSYAKNVVKHLFPEKCTSKNFVDGECEIPTEMIDFYVQVLSHSRFCKKPSKGTLRLAKSLSQDIVYGVHKGKIIPSKHVTLGLTIKGFTGSKRIINILNRYGHICSYSTLEGLETEATYASSNERDVCPPTIRRQSHLSTGLAFDNYDRFVDTPTGKDTMHDTVGIIYQFIDESDLDVDESSRESNTTSSSYEDVPAGKKRKRRRTFNEITFELENIHKKPKVSEFLQPLDVLEQLVPSINLQSLRNINYSWVLSHLLKIKDTPMWVGYNSLLYADNTPKQRIAYLTTINSSPTNKETVLETLKQCLQAASECEADYVQVTYDLGIAKPAFQLQSTFKPRFDKVFIHVGMFHVKFCFYKGQGKYIDNSGITNILVDTGHLADGSLNSFILAKHFNRCKRIHVLLYLALRILHFQQFIKDENIDLDAGTIQYLLAFPKVSAENPEVSDEILKDIFEKYEIYSEKTLQGEHGKTAKFYMIYMHNMDNLFSLETGIRTGNFKLFRHSLPSINNLCFTFNFQNYSRYLAKYSDNLAKVDETHPGLREEFEKGSFGIKRTDKSFSRQAVDYSLETTINSNAANKLSGLSYSANSGAYRQKWTRSHTLRTEMLAYILEDTDLRRKQDITEDLKKCRIKLSTLQLRSLLNGINDNVNPFSKEVNPNYLYNISTGKSVPENVESFLLNVNNLGDKQRRQFITECSLDSERFEKPIHRNKIYTFSDSLKKNKMLVKGHVVEARMQRDLFGHLLRISLEIDLDISKTLAYPLTPFPLSMCHVDGSICKTDKSALMKILDREIEKSSVPEHADVLIIDGFFVLHSLKEMPATFGNISKKVLQAFLNTRASTVIIAFDVYKFPSIKDYEREVRGLHKTNFCIKGPEQLRPADFTSELKNVNFKDSLINFFIKDWGQDYMAALIGEKHFYVNYDQCYKYQVVDQHVERTLEINLSCPKHEEADTKIVYHACQLEANKNVTIRCSDTDITIIMLANMNQLKQGVQISIDCGTGNHRRFINLSKLYQSLGPTLSMALAGFHAFTGCDFNATFFRKGKQRPYNLLKKSDKYIEAFSNISNIEELDDTFIVMQQFVCEIYSLKKIKSVNEARATLFLQKYKPSEKKTIAEIIAEKPVDASSLPPCESELYQHFLRSSYIADIWRHAYRKIPVSGIPEERGWKEAEDKLIFNWFEGEQLPATIEDLKLDKNSNDINDSNEDLLDEDPDNSSDEELSEDMLDTSASEEEE